jgi:hypothetical protein
MIGSEINVELDKHLKMKECEQISERISKMKGVFSAHFNKKAKAVRVHYSGLEEVCDEIKKVAGVKGFNHDGIPFRM